MNRRGFFKNLAGAAALAVAMNLPVSFAALQETRLSRVETLVRVMKRAQERIVANMVGRVFSEGTVDPVKWCLPADSAYGWKSYGMGFSVDA